MLEEVRPRPRASGPGRLAVLLPAVLVLWGFVAAYLLQLSIDTESEARLREKLVAELMYFPSGKFLRQVSIEYQHAAADFVWLRGIQYYGYHMMTDQRYDWLGHVFDMLTTLDPRFIGAYHFGAYTLAWDAKQPQEAIRMLVDGMKDNPMDWQLPFDAGFISYMQLDDYEQAGKFFAIAAKLPGAWQIAARWAAVSVARAGQTEEARQLWLDIYNGTENKALKALVLRQLRKLSLDEAIARLQEAADRFRQDKGRAAASLGELRDAGYVEDIPREPFGGRFYIDGGRVMSTTPVNRRG